MTLSEFEPIFRADIAPLYIQHQKDFDADGIHGCLHIARSLVICRVLAQVMSEIWLGVNVGEITYAVAFHDSGREANGIDYWESFSRQNCYDYLVSKNIPNADRISNWILKGADITPDSICVYDADVMEIVRPSTGIGIFQFNKKFLKGYNLSNSRYEDVMCEVFPFILETEQVGVRENYFGEDSLAKIIDYIIFNKIKYPFIYKSIFAN